MKEYKGVILALDIAAKTGYALYKDSLIFKTGTWNFNPNGKLGASQRLAAFYKTLINTIQRYGVTEVIAENYYLDRTKPTAGITLGEYHGVLRLIIGLHHLSLQLLDPMTIKTTMHVYSKHNTRKELKQRMINAVTNCYGYTLEKPNADDEADAIGLMIAHLKINGYKVTHSN
jgi:Holliday junction resolvasome RuvABC endonuclease subunit